MVFKRKIISWVLLGLLLVVVACFLIPTHFSGRQRVRRVQCAGRLCNIGKLMLLYADKHRGNFPISEKPGVRAHDTFQVLVDAMPEECKPEAFICPGTDDVPAHCDENGMFKLRVRTKITSGFDSLAHATFGCFSIAKFSPYP